MLEDRCYRHDGRGNRSFAQGIILPHNRRIDALGGINPDMGNRRVADFLQSLRILKQKAFFPERVIDPGSAKRLDIHANAQIGHDDFFSTIKPPFQVATTPRRVLRCAPRSNESARYGT